MKENGGSCLFCTSFGRKGRHDRPIRKKRRTSTPSDDERALSLSLSFHSPLSTILSLSEWVCVGGYVGVWVVGCFLLLLLYKRKASWGLVSSVASLATGDWRGGRLTAEPGRFRRSFQCDRADWLAPGSWAGRKGDIISAKREGSLFKRAPSRARAACTTSFIISMASS